MHLQSWRDIKHRAKVFSFYFVRSKPKFNRRKAAASRASGWMRGRLWFASLVEWKKNWKTMNEWQCTTMREWKRIPEDCNNVTHPVPASGTVALKSFQVSSSLRCLLAISTSGNSILVLLSFLHFRSHSALIVAPLLMATTLNFNLPRSPQLKMNYGRDWSRGNLFSSRSNVSELE